MDLGAGHDSVFTQGIDPVDQATRGPASVMNDRDALILFPTSRFFSGSAAAKSDDNREAIRKVIINCE